MQVDKIPVKFAWAVLGQGGQNAGFIKSYFNEKNNAE